MCIINSCQADIKMCVFSLLPTLLPTSTGIPQARYMFYYCYFRISSRSSVTGSYLVKWWCIFIEDKRHFPEGKTRKTGMKPVSQPPAWDWALLRVVTVSLKSVWASGKCKEEFYPDPWGLRARNQCEGKRSEEKI